MVSIDYYLGSDAFAYFLMSVDDAVVSFSGEVHEWYRGQTVTLESA